MKHFLDYTEIKTKITSLFAFLLSLAWLICNGQTIHWDKTILFFLSMFLFDLTTTAINNYVDTKTNSQVLPFSRPMALFIIFALLFISSCLGLSLVFLTDITVLLLGGLCFICGVFYTFGPLPISRLPLGEVFSGIFYGLAIPFLVLYINSPTGMYISLSFSGKILTLTFDLFSLLMLFLLGLAPVCATANIMLCNNICDLEEDILVKRHTLPYYLGIKKSLILFTILSYLPYVAAIVMVLLGLSPLYLFLLFTIIPIQRNINIFYKEQSKAKTFLCSIKNYVILLSADVILIYLCQ